MRSFVASVSGAPDEPTLACNPHISCVISAASVGTMYNTLDYAITLARSFACLLGRRFLFIRLPTAARLLRTRVDNVVGAIACADVRDFITNSSRLPLPLILTSSALFLSGPGTIRFRVSGAGAKVSNGIYTMAKVPDHDDCAVFVRLVGSLSLSLLRFFMDNGNHQVQSRYAFITLICCVL